MLSFLVKFDIGEIVEVIPDVFLEVVVCPRQVTHGLNKIKLQVRVVGNVGNHTGHRKIVFIIFSDRLFKHIGTAEIFHGHFFRDNNTFRVLKRVFAVSFNKGKGEHPEEIRVSIDDAFLLELDITDLDQVAIDTR